MMHNYLFHDLCNVKHINYHNINNYNYKYTKINLEYISKARFCVENPFAKKLQIIEQDSVMAYCVYWILGNVNKCNQIKQMVLLKMQCNGNSSEFDAINRLEAEYLTNVNRMSVMMRSKMSASDIDMDHQGLEMIMQLKHSVVKQLLQIRPDLSKNIEKKNRLSINTFNNYASMKLLNNLSMGKQCSWYKCKKKSEKLLKCKQCKNVTYCSRVCQKKDWRFKHRLVCQ